MSLRVMRRRCPCCCRFCHRAGVYSVGPATQKQILSCAELASRRHSELQEQLQQGVGSMQQ
jgi:hypothetical protein